jgi:nucleotide-binding universal stress UspA family protein
VTTETARPEVSIRRILCAIDFSPASPGVVEQAVALARRDKAQITGLHVYSPMVAPIPILPAPADRVSQTEVERIRDSITACFAAVSKDLDVDAAVDIGRPATAIIERAASLSADMIVMGTHGARGVERFLLGSVAEHVLRHARCPVLTLHAQRRSSLAFEWRRYLCAVDLSEPSLAALQYTLSLARTHGGVVTVLLVIEWPWVEPPPPVLSDLPPEQAAALSEYRRYVETTATARLEALVRDAAIDAVAVRVRHGKPYVEILRTAEDEQVDVIVTGVGGRSAVDMALLGSTTNQVVRRASCPVLTLPAL